MPPKPPQRKMNVSKTSGKVRKEKKALRPSPTQERKRSSHEKKRSTLSSSLAFAVPSGPARVQGPRPGIRLTTPVLKADEMFVGAEYIQHKPHLDIRSLPGDRVRVSFYLPCVPIGSSSATYGMTGFLPMASTSAGGTTSVTPMAMIGWNPIRSVGGYYSSTSYTLYDTFMDNVMLPLTALGYSRYSFASHKLKLGYESLVSTTSTLAYSLCVSSDYDHPSVGFGALYGNQPLTMAACRNGVNNVSWPAWMPWQAEMDIDTRPEYYTYLYSRAGTAIAQSDRIAIPMSLMCIANQNAGVYQTGVLWMGGELEFFDKTPVVRVASSAALLSTILSPLELPERLVRTADHRHEEKEEKKDDGFVDLDPPRQHRARPSGLSPGFHHDEPDLPPPTPSSSRVPSRK